MENIDTCKSCIFWKGRTDLNKCKLHPEIVPEWYVGCKDHKELK